MNPLHNAPRDTRVPDEQKADIDRLMAESTSAEISDDELKAVSGGLRNRGYDSRQFRSSRSRARGRYDGGTVLP